jgi:Uma2 family endonuclease
MSVESAPPRVVYPDSDGMPMADNTLQFRWIVTIKGNLDIVFAGREDVFVAGDLLWYPVEGRPDIRAAPDVMVAFGRPKGERGSYRQWEEAGVAPQVAFEVLSPGNRAGEMDRKFEFYERHGVEEYYVYDPDNATLDSYRRAGRRLAAIPEPFGWVSPRMGIRFASSGQELVLYRPDGRRFLTFVEINEQYELQLAEAERVRREAEAYRREAERADAMLDIARKEAEAARSIADAATELAEAAAKQVDAAKSEAEAQRRRAERLAERLRELGIDPDSAS